MLKYPGTPETCHFANWLLYSGCIAPAELVREAREQAKADLAKEPAISKDEYGDYLAEATLEKLQLLLEEKSVEWACDFATGYFDADFEVGFCSYGSGVPEVPKGYQGMESDHLFAPLLAWAIDRIDYSEVAQYIFAQVNPLMAEAA